MGKIFDIDSPIMRFMAKVADLMILNILVIISCIPIVTAGAGFTAMHYVLLKMARKEEGYIVKGFFKSFKENLKQATIIWLIVLAFVVVFVGDLLIINYSAVEIPRALVVTLMAVAIIVFMIICYVFPVLARFENTVVNTIKNAFFMAILNFPKTILMVVLYVAPLLIGYFIVAAVPLVVLFGFSAPAYVAAILYSGIFKKFEPQEEIVTDEDFHINMEASMSEGQGDKDER